MKVYVCVDMEGIGGIVMPSQLREGQYHYNEGRQLLTEEVNAVVEALLQSGATRIIVRDIHATGFNLIIERLHPGADYVIGATKKGRFPGIDPTFDGAILLGYHGMAGTRDAIRDHTYSAQRYTAMRLNERPIGEIGIDALLLGCLNIPVWLVTGDDKACTEAKEQLGDVATYETKIGWGRHCGIVKPPRRVRVEIREAVQQAVAARAQCKPYKQPGPYELSIHYMTTDLADAYYCDGERTVRADGLTILHRDTDIERLLLRVL